MLVGRQLLGDEASIIKHAALRSGEAYKHTLETWRELVSEVVGGMGLEVEHESEMMDIKRNREERKWKMMRFCVALK